MHARKEESEKTNAFFFFLRARAFTKTSLGRVDLIYGPEVTREKAEKREKRRGKEEKEIREKRNSKKRKKERKKKIGLEREMGR